MKRQMFSWALLACIAAGALVLSGCSTVSSRIDANRAGFDRSLAAGSGAGEPGKNPRRDVAGGGLHRLGPAATKSRREVHGVPTETWVYTLSRRPLTDPIGYVAASTAGLPAASAITAGMAVTAIYGAFIDPFYDPFYYPFSGDDQQPVKTVSFQRGRVIAFQYPDAERLLSVGRAQVLCTRRLTRSSTVTMPVRLCCLHRPRRRA